MTELQYQNRPRFLVTSRFTIMKTRVQQFFEIQIQALLHPYLSVNL